MKFKKASMLLLSGLMVTALSGCSVAEVKSWFSENVISKITGGKSQKQQEEQKQEEEQQQGGEEQQQGGEEEHHEEQPINLFTVKFVDYNQKVLQSSRVREGVVPEYKGAEPKRAADAQYTYAFAGWDKPIVAVTENTTYTATYSTTVNEYEIKFVNYDNSELQKEVLPYGAMPEYKGATPTRESDDLVYTFEGWDKPIAEVTGKATYKATYTSHVAHVSYKFMNGTVVLQEGSVNYGEAPVYTGETPTKDATAQYTFEFAGWDPEVGPITENTVYRAQFTENLRSYQVTFDTKGGTEIPAQTVEYGKTVEKPADPEKGADAEHIYFFEEWQVGGKAYDFATPVTGPLTLEAKYDAVSATEHAHRCVYTHYAAKAADYVNAGYKEFWMCELHNSFVMAQPTEGKVNEATAEFAGEIAATDARYVAPLEGGNFFARINVGPTNNNGAALPVFRTANSYSHVTAFTLKYRISGALAEGKTSSWMGFYVGAENKDVYSVYESACGGKDVSLYDYDGQWHEVTVRYSGEGFSGYFAFGHALTNFAEGTYVDIDDLVIYADEVVSEEFARTPSAKLIESEFVKIGGEAKVELPDSRNSFMRIALQQGKDIPFAYSFKSYSNITSIKFKFRLNKDGYFRDGKDVAWFGVASRSTQIEPSDYNDDAGHMWNTKTINTSNASSYFSGLWQTYELTGLNTEGYVAFVAAADFKTGTLLDIDDVEIVTSNGTITENFENKPYLFGDHSKAGYQGHVSIGVEELISTDKAFDPEKGELVLYNYSNKNTLVTENVTDAEKGTCVKIKSLHGYDTIWFGFSQTASNEELLRGLDGKAPTEFYFSVYNSGASDILLQLHYGKDDWNNRPATTFKAGQWTDITLKIDENITDISKISYYKWVGGDADNQVVICDENAQLTFTAIRVRHVDAAVNPAPFGTVAWDAQTGGVRDIKGRSNTATVSHGVDNDYGAYIQLDDWTCGAGGNLCWLTLSDTAKSVDDIKTELGGDIENYFFYIYNPLDDAFTFRMMLQSSSAMNPNVNINCAAKAWTKVSVDYGHADNGSYPALTSASQIGLDHQCANKGDSIGSGWKITSVYAEKSSSADPAPFGVVAWNALNGGLRDIKGRSNTATVTNNLVDDTYGAYILVDDWTCGAGGNLCWLTLSDTAKSVADIETELGTSITNYFFYIYNPTANAFTFRIMARSSSGLNPGISVSCAAGAWTKVTIDYNHSDTGYDPITVASQIGLDHQCANNGDSIGSGWKITSVYAE